MPQTKRLIVTASTKVIQPNTACMRARGREIGREGGRGREGEGGREREGVCMWLQESKVEGKGSVFCIVCVCVCACVCVQFLPRFLSISGCEVLCTELA